MEEFHALLREWETFGLLVGTAGATLAGLTFVAITIVSERATSRQEFPIVRAHIDPALLAFVLNLVLSALLLIPTLSRPWFGAFLLATGLLGLLYMARVLRQLILRVRVTWDLSDWLWYAGAPVASSVLLTVSGVLGLWDRGRDALTLLGVALVLLLSMGIRNTWDLVTFTIARMPETEEPGPGQNR